MEHDILNVLLYLWGLLALSVVTINWLYESYKKIFSHDKNDNSNNINPLIASTVCERVQIFKAYPVSSCKSKDDDEITWLSELLHWWHRQNGLQVDKWLKIWISSLNDYLASHVGADSRIEILQFVAASNRPKIVSVVRSSSVDDAVQLDDSFLSLTIGVVLENLRFQIRVQEHSFNVTLERVEGKLILGIQQDLTAVKFNVKFEECPHIDCFDIQPTTEQFSALLNLQLIDALVNTETSLLLDSSTKSAAAVLCSDAPFGHDAPESPKKTSFVEETVSICNSNSYGYSTSEGKTCAQNDKVSRRPLRIPASVKSNIIKPNVLKNARNLMVKIVKASGLKPDMVSDSKSAALHARRGTFVMVQLDDPFQQRSTGVAAPGGNQPFWDQHFFFELGGRSKKLTLEVFDRQGSHCNLFLGTASVELEKITFMSSRLIQPLRSHNDTTEGVDGLLTFELLFMETSEAIKRLPAKEFDGNEIETSTACLSTSFDQKELEKFMKSPLKVETEEEVRVAVHNAMNGTANMTEINSATTSTKETNGHVKSTHSCHVEFVSQDCVEEPLTISSSIQHLEFLQKRKTFGSLMKRWRGLFLSAARRANSRKNRTKGANDSTMSDGLLGSVPFQGDCKSRDDILLQRKNKKIRLVIPRFLRRRKEERGDSSDADFASTLQSIKSGCVTAFRTSEQPRVACPIVFYSKDNKKISLSAQQLLNIEQQLQQPQLYQKYLQKSSSRTQIKV